MNKQDFFKSFVSPCPNANLALFPKGNITQYWADNPHLYSSAFGKHDDFSKHVCGHTGIDIVTFEGDEMVASHDGTVVHMLYNNPLGGNVIYLRSDNFVDGENCYAITSYGHLGAMFVKQGDRVKAGQKIGTQSNTGFVISGGTPYWGNAPHGKGVHLHFGYVEFLSNGEYRYPSCLGNTSDPLPIIMQDNPDYSGTQILLANMKSYLNKLLLRV
jgi:murein DD-endopeptidase MepM/ murein hydrolase activator NlpD